MRSPGEFQAGVNVLAPDPRRQSIVGVVHQNDSLIERFECQHRQHGAEDFLAGDGHVAGDIRHHRRLIELAAQSGNFQHIAAKRYRGAGCPGFLNIGIDFVVVFRCDDRADLGRWVQRVAKRNQTRERNSPCNKFFRYILVHDDPGSRVAAFTGIEIDPENNGIRRGVEIRVRKDHLRVLAPEFQGNLLQCARGCFDDRLADSRRTGEGHHVDPLVGGHCCANRIAKAEHDVGNADGDSCFQKQLAQDDGCRWCHLRGFDDGCTPRCERKGKLLRHDQERKIPRCDDRDDPYGFLQNKPEKVVAQRIVALAMKRACQRRRVSPDIGSTLDLGHCLAYRLAGFNRLVEGNTLPVPVDQVGNFQQECCPVLAGGGRPASLVKGAPCGRNGSINIQEVAPAGDRDHRIM